MKIKIITSIIILVSFILTFKTFSNFTHSLIMATISNKYYGVSRFLLKTINDVNEVNNGMALIHFFCSAGDIEAVKLLLSVGANINHDIDRTSSPLSWAMHSKSSEMIKYLINNGAELNPQYLFSTPLISAISTKNLQIIKILVSAGADVNLSNSDGLTPFAWAAFTGDVSILEYLLNSGANIDNQSLPIAASNAQEIAVRWLIDRDIPIDSINSEGATALNMVSVDDHDIIGKYLIQKGADVNHQDQKGFTALHTTAFYGSEKMARLLLAHGADLNIKDNEGLRPIDISKQNGHEKVTELLNKFIK